MSDMLTLLPWLICEVREEWFLNERLWFNDPGRTGRYGLHASFLVRKVAIKSANHILTSFSQGRFYPDTYHKNLPMTKVLNLLHEPAPC